MGNHVSHEEVVKCRTSLDKSSVYAMTKDLTYDVLYGDDDPQDLCCPITQELFKDPVLLVTSGHTYEREAIEKWLIGEKRKTDPITGQSLSDFILVPNYAMRKAVELWLKCKQRFLKLNDICYKLQGQKFELSHSKQMLEQQNVLLKQQLANSMYDSSSSELEKIQLKPQPESRVSFQYTKARTAY